jgi:hypothetical protein
VGRTITYSEPWWLAFRYAFVAMLVSMGIVPACGATLPDGPTTNPSQCQQHGLVTFASSRGALHLHHEPSLTEAERQDRAVVCDPRRIVLLCDVCHNAWTSATGGRGSEVWPTHPEKAAPRLRAHENRFQGLVESALNTSEIKGISD